MTILPGEMTITLPHLQSLDASFLTYIESKSHKIPFCIASKCFFFKKLTVVSFYSLYQTTLIYTL